MNPKLEASLDIVGLFAATLIAFGIGYLFLLATP